MKTKKEVANLQEIENLLESDDELPSSYNEDSAMPAYANDDRFNPIVFKWIDNPEMQAYFSNTVHDQTESLSECQDNSENILRKDFERKYISKGFLSKRDLLCLKYIAGSVSDAIVLWFVDFLVHKNLQSKYQGKFKSCLVNTFPCDGDYLNTKDEYHDFNSIKKKYKIVVKVKDNLQRF
ncbi:uncharacterized protein LOC119829406 [Zerene cesonia]|uniref:uncharacterized protein LOC119829406 n=1 Tax=Zerene cesonia TaxID=33412 RepID=UPI0018E575BF|nr:uncharacterized protein LOC119829406 [Zerene cesonia]